MSHPRRDGTRAGPGPAAVAEALPILSIDNRELALADREWKLGALSFILVLIVALALEVLVVVETGLPGPSHQVSASGWTDLAWVGLLAAVLATAVLGIRRLLPGAREIAIEHDGVRLRYGLRSEELIRWRSGGRLLVRDYSDNPEMKERGRAYHIRTPSFWTRRTLVSKETVEALLAYARSSGVPVRQRARQDGSRVGPTLEYSLGG